MGTTLGTEPCRTPCYTVTNDAWKCLKSQLHNISGCNSGLQVRVLPGSPTLSQPPVPATINSELVSASVVFASVAAGLQPGMASALRLWQSAGHRSFPPSPAPSAPPSPHKSIRKYHHHLIRI